MTTFQKRALLVLTTLLLILLFVLLWGWQIALVLSIVLSIGLSIPFSTLWHAFGQTPAQPEPEQQHEWEEVPSYEQGYQPVVSYHVFPGTVIPKEESFTDEVPVAQYQYPEITQY